MKHNVVAFLMLTAVSCLSSMSVYGHLYGSLIDTASWKLEPSRLACKLWQPVPSYGTAVFYRRAGEQMKFYLDSQRKIKFAKKARIFSAPPAWMHGKRDNPIAMVKESNGFRPILIDHNLASLVMAELQRGRIAVVEHSGWYTNHLVEIEVSSINFTKAYEGFVACLADLLPANFDQLERTTFYFRGGMHWLERSYRDRIKMISEYIAVDKSVARIYVDGHTDNLGRTGENWDLSRRRAEVVKEIMLSEGIPEDMIVLRYHGEHYPVAKNNSARNRAKNRRVTLRLEKG